jgi:hypothetical protein
MFGEFGVPMSIPAPFQFRRHSRKEDIAAPPANALIIGEEERLGAPVVALRLAPVSMAATIAVASRRSGSAQSRPPKGY